MPKGYKTVRHEAPSTRSGGFTSEAAGSTGMSSSSKVAVGCSLGDGAAANQQHNADERELAEMLTSTAFGKRDWSASDTQRAGEILAELGHVNPITTSESE